MKHQDWWNQWKKMNVHTLQTFSKFFVSEICVLLSALIFLYWSVSDMALPVLLSKDSILECTHHCWCSDCCCGLNWMKLHSWGPRDAWVVHQGLWLVALFLAKPGCSSLQEVWDPHFLAITHMRNFWIVKCYFNR